MRVSLNFLVRIIGMAVLAYIGNQLGHALSSPQPTDTEQLAIQLLTLACAGLGVLTTQRWTIEPLQEGLRYFKSISIAELIAVVFGALIGLLLALLLAVPLAQLPSPFGRFLPIIGSITLAYLGAMVFSARKKEIGGLLKMPRPSLVLPQQLLEGLRRRVAIFLTHRRSSMAGSRMSPRLALSRAHCSSRILCSTSYRCWPTRPMSSGAPRAGAGWIF